MPTLEGRKRGPIGASERSERCPLPVWGFGVRNFLILKVLTALLRHTSGLYFRLSWGIFQEQLTFTHQTFTSKSSCDPFIAISYRNFDKMAKKQETQE